MDIMILEYIDDIEHGSLISEYEVIQSLCDSYIKQIHMNQFVLEDGESKPDDGKKKDSDKGSTSKPPSFLEKAINFVKRLIVKIRTMIGMKRVGAFQNIYKRNWDMFENKYQETMYKNIDNLVYVKRKEIVHDDGVEKELEYDTAVYPIKDIIAIKPKWIENIYNTLDSFINNCSKSLSAGEASSSRLLLTYYHDIKYDTLVKKIESYESKINEKYEELGKLEKDMRDNSENPEVLVPRYKSILEKINMPDAIEQKTNEEHVFGVFFAREGSKHFSKIRMMYYYINDAEKSIKDAKAVEKLYGEEKNNDNLSFFAKYITKFMILMHKFTLIFVKVLSVSALELKHLCRKIGIKDIGKINTFYDPNTLEDHQSKYTVDDTYHTTRKDLKSQNVSKNEIRAFT